MVIKCAVAACPFRSKWGLCRNKLVNITDQGFCGQIYDKRNQIKPNWNYPVDQIYKEQEKGEQV